MHITPAPLTIGVLALQGGFAEHLALLRRASQDLPATGRNDLTLIEVRNREDLARCDALIIPGGESTTMAIVASRLGLLEPLRQFVRTERKPVWGTCAGLVLLAEAASATKKGGQELIGGLDIKVERNSYGRQTESFVADVDLPFLGSQDSSLAAGSPFRGIFIRAPVVEEILSRKGPAEGPPDAAVEILGVLRRPGSQEGDSEDVVALRQAHVFATSFHPELTDDARIHLWWLRTVLDTARHSSMAA